MRSPFYALISAIACALAACAPEEADDPSVRLWLHASRGAESESIALVENESFELGGHSLSVLDVRQWRGLLNRQTGIALLHFSIQPVNGEWVEDLVLKSGDRIVVSEDLAIEFHWATPLPPGTGRWGLRDEGRTSWNESFLPGTGFERSDGIMVALVEHEPSGAIRVRIGEGDRAREVLVEPGTETEGIVNAAVPSAEFALHVFSEQSGAATVVTKGANGRSETSMHRGESLRFNGAELLLHDVQPESVYVQADQSPWLEAIFDVEGEPNSRLRVREGMVERLGDWRLRVSQTALEE